LGEIARAAQILPVSVLV